MLNISNATVEEIESAFESGLINRFQCEKLKYDARVREKTGKTPQEPKFSKSFVAMTASDVSDAILEILHETSEMKDTEVVDAIFERRVDISESETFNARAVVSLRLFKLYTDGFLIRTGAGGKKDQFRYSKA